MKSLRIGCQLYLYTISVNFYEGLKNGNLASSIVHLTDNLDLIPGTFDLMLLPKLTRSWTFENESRLLATLLAPLKSDYDLIIITLNDENGNEVEFEFLDLIPYRQNEYVVLLPIGDSDGQVVILQLKEIDDETEEYVGVENEFVLETVFALFKERNKDFFTFE